MKDMEKLQEAKEVLQKIAKGLDPLTGELISEDSFLQDSQMIRTFYFMIEVLDNVARGVYSRSRAAAFRITPEEKEKVVLPDSKIGVNLFSRCVNSCIDAEKSRLLTGVDLNRKLKALGVLSETVDEKQKKRTVTNEKSAEFGFETEKRVFNGVEYEAVVMNEAGKKYLLENLESIMTEKLSA